MDKYGIIGYPLGHTFSPQIHNPAFRALSLNAQYGVYQISPDSFEDRINALKEADNKGFNVTVPYKQSIIPFIDVIDPLAKKVNAVNTIKRVKDQWYGYNTDLFGFLEPIRNDLQHIKNVLVIGAGGAANAVCFALAESKYVKSINLINRTKSNAEVLKNRLKKYYDLPVQTITSDNPGLEKYDLMVNTTSVGMGKMADQNPFDINGSYHSASIAYDLIYNPQETLFLQTAKDRKLKTINGLSMLLGQAAQSFLIWTGHEYPAGSIDETIFYK